MLNRKTIIEKYKNNFEQFEKAVNEQKEHSLRNLRNDAMRIFEELGVPTKKDEEWRFTDLQPLFDKPFRLILPQGVSFPDKRELCSFLYQNFNGPQFVFVDGVFSAELSTAIDRETFGIVLTSLSGHIREDVRALHELGEEKTIRANAFAALNTAFATDGMVIRVPDNVVIEAPVNILYISSRNARGTAHSVRNMIKIGKHAQARIIETYLSLAETDHFTNTMTTIDIAAGGRLIHNKIQNESVQAFHIGNLFVRQNQNSRFVSNNIAFGGKLVRNNITVTLQGQGADTHLYGLYLGNRQQHIDNNTLIDHAVSECTSNELYQGILSDKATAVFSGKILVRPDAQKTDAVQNNRCLLLSDDARINTKPQLEIYADDVKCTHGATVGQLDEEAIFYLRSRGISQQRAKNLMIYAFAEHIIEQMKVASVREFVDAILLKRFKENMNFVK